MRIDREEFLRCLEAVVPGIAERETVEQSSCFAFRDSHVHTFDGEDVACRIPTPLDPSFTGAVKASSLLGILRSLSAEKITLEPSETEFAVLGPHSRTDMRMEKNIALPIGIVGEVGEWKPLAFGFSEAIAVVAECAGTKGSLSECYRCVRIGPDVLEATDNFQVCRWPMETGFEESLISRKAAKHVGTLGMVDFSETPTWVHFKNPQNLVLSCRRYPREGFADLSAVSEVVGTPVSLSKSIAEAVERRASIFAQEKKGKDEAVRVFVELKPGNMRIVGEGVTGRHREWFSVSYNGPPLSFFIFADVLKGLASKHSEVVVSERRILVKNPLFTYLASLTPPPKKVEKVEVSDEEDVPLEEQSTEDLRDRLKELTKGK